MFKNNNRQGDNRKDRKYSNKMGKYIILYDLDVVVDCNDLPTCIKFPMKKKVVVDEEKGVMQVWNGSNTYA